MDNQRQIKIDVYPKEIYVDGVPYSDLKEAKSDFDILGSPYKLGYICWKCNESRIEKVKKFFGFKN